jgi:hypothetical protein
MKTIFENYNTQRDALIISEYGRSIQEYVNHLNSIFDREKRTSMAYAIVEMMGTVNSEIKKQQNYKEVLWGHLHQISNYTLDVESPYELPSQVEVQKKPEHIGYPTTGIKFRFYGRNLQNMVDSLIEVEDKNTKQELLNLVASFMFNSSRAWNDERLSNEAIAEHISRLSQGKLSLSSDDFEVTQDNYVPKKNTSSNSNSKKHSKNKNRNKRKTNYRRY